MNANRRKLSSLFADINITNNNGEKKNVVFVPIPTEILSQILSYLNKDYISLYNCLLVNKFWYINVIEILYSDPFNLLLQSNNNNITSSASSKAKDNHHYNNLRKTIIYSKKNRIYNNYGNTITIENRIVKLIDLYIKCLKKANENDFKIIENELNEKGIFYVYNNQDYINDNNFCGNNNINNKKNNNNFNNELLLDYSSYLRYLRFDDLFNFTSIYLNSFSNNNTFFPRKSFSSPFINSNYDNNSSSNSNNYIKKSLYTYNPNSVITKRTIVIELFKKFLNQRKNLIELSINTNFINDFKNSEYFNGVDQDLFDIFDQNFIVNDKKKCNDEDDGDNDEKNIKTSIDNYNNNNLRTLICGGVNFDKILKLLQDNLKLNTIKNFIMDFNLPYNFYLSGNYISSDNIVKFLSFQKNLKKLCVIGRYYELYDVFFKLSQKNILERLTCLEFYGIVFNNNLTTTSGNIHQIYQDQGNNNNDNDNNDNNYINQERSLINGIICCYNLKELVFEDCVNLTSDTLCQLRNSKFTSLKKFTFRNCSGKNINSLSSNDSLSTLLKNTKGAIEEIRFGRKLKWSIRKIYDVNNIVLEEIMSFKNLKIIECCVLVDIFEKFLKILKNCKKLEKVIISIDFELIYNEIFWKKFGKSLSKNRSLLNELSICIGGVGSMIGGGGGNNFFENELWIEMFEWFFNSCDIPIDILKFPMCYSINENYLKIISKYAKRVGGIKKIMLCEGIIKRKNLCGLRIEKVQCIQVCRDDVEFGDDDLTGRVRFRGSI